MKRKKGSGGTRKGAGRKTIEPTKLVAYRIPLSLIEKVNIVVKDMIAKHKQTTEIVHKIEKKECSCSIVGYMANNVPILHKCENCKRLDR